MPSHTDYLARGHENLGRLLLVLDSHLSRALSGETPDMQLMHGIVDYVIDYVERQHNPVEQLVLTRLARRERWLDSLVEAHARELRELRLSMARFSGLLARARVDPSFDREELAHAGRAFVAALRRRVLVEDAELLPAAEQALDAEDWRSIEAALRTPGVREESAEDARFESEFHDLAQEAGCECEYA